MTDDTREELSALMDGELARAQTVRAVEGTLRDDALRRRWHRYHLIGAAVRGELEIADGALAQRLRAAIDAQPTAMLRRRPSRVAARPWRAAVAASLVLATAGVAYVASIDDPPSPAVVADVGQLVGTPPEAAVAQPGTAVAQAKTPSTRAMRSSPVRSLPLADAAQARATTLRWNGDLLPAAARRLNDYLLNHNERGTITGMHLYARIVVYEPRYR
jgi:sigma-E factor negative regulatory protein RseA